MGDSNNYLQSLEEKGYAIIHNVLTPEEVKYARELVYKWQESVPDLSELHKYVDPHGIYKYCEIAHQRHCWYVRTRPAVQKVFKDIWETDDLVVSFDGSCYFPKEYDKEDRYWTHSDQSSDKFGRRCVQGLVALTHNKERTIRVYEGTHNLHEEYFEERDIFNSNDWNLIDKDYIDQIENRRRVIEVPEGSMVIWDSRTFHQNQYGPPGCEERMVQYVCYLPRNSPLYTDKTSMKRWGYFNEKRTTSHWPYPVVPVPKQPIIPNFEGDVIDYSLLQEPDLDDLMPEIEKLI